MWLNLYILIFIILSFFSPTFNHTQRLPFPRHRLAGWLQVQIAPSSSSIAVSVIPEGVAQEVQALAALLQVQHASLFAVDMQPQPSFQFAFDPSPQLWADIAGQYDKIVRIANQLCLGPLRRSIRPLEQVVEPVPLDVAQQRTPHAYFRSAPVIAPHRRGLALSRRL